MGTRTIRCCVVALALLLTAWPLLAREDKPQQPRKPNPDAPPPIRDYGFSKPNKRDLDASIEAEMAAALAGLNVENSAPCTCVPALP